MGVFLVWRGCPERRSESPSSPIVLRAVMADIALLLGPVVFRDFEVPPRINIGGAQRVAVHRLVGGARVIDSLGRDDAELRFEGVFSGQDATLRARTLDQLRAAGAPLPLTWDVFYYTAILTRFEADYRTPWWIPFRIACTVLRDEAAALAQTVFSLTDSIGSDMAAAISWADGASIGLSGAQSALSATNATVRGTSDYAGALASLGAANDASSTAISSAETALNTSGINTASSASAGVTALNAAVSANQQLAGLAIAQGYLGRATVNLANAST